MVGSIPTIANLVAKLLIRYHKLPFNGLVNTIGVAYSGSIFTVERFPLMGSIQAQTWGDYIFVRRDINLLNAAGIAVLRHELKHVEQFHRYGFWGLGFLLRYWLQFLWYTRGFPLAITYALHNMPLEKEAYDFQKKNND